MTVLVYDSMISFIIDNSLIILLSDYIISLLLSVIFYIDNSVSILLYN